MLLAMLDQFALSMLTHLPEIPEAQREQALATEPRRHRGLRARSRRQLQTHGSRRERPGATTRTATRRTAPSSMR